MERTASPLSTATGAVIRGRYKKRGLTLAALSQKTGIRPATLQRLIAGDAEIDMDHLAALAPVLGVSVASILAEAEADLAQVSEASPTTDAIDIRRKQNEARAMTVEQIEALPHAATRDPEMDTDEPN